MRYFRQLASQTLIYGLSGVAGRMTALVLLPVLTRALSPTEYGIIDVLTTVGSFLGSVVLLGMNASLVNFFYDNETEESQRQVVATVFVFLFAWATVVLVAASSFGRPLFSSLLQVDVPVVVVVLALTTACLSAIRDQFSSLFRLLVRPWSYAFVTVGGMLATYGLIVALVVSKGQGVRGFFLGMSIGTLLTIVAAFLPLRDWVRGEVSLPLLKRMLLFGIPLAPTDMILWTIPYFERMSILRVLSADALGVYAVGVRVASIVGLATFAFRLAWAPLSLSIQKRPDANAFYAMVDRSLKAGVGLLAIILGAVSYPLLVILTPPAYHGGYRVVGVVAYGVFFSSIYWVSGLGTMLAKKPKHLTTAILVSASVALILFPLLTPWLGTVGTALAGCLAHVSGNCTILYLGERVYKIGFSVRRTLATVAWTLSVLAAQIQIYEGDYVIWAKVGLTVCLILLSCGVLLWLALGRDAVRLPARFLHRSK